MPRQNSGRTVDAEANLALRIKYERDRRQQSYEGLADLMTKAGCAINGSAIYRIEKGSPRRGVSVDELVTLAKVWDLSVPDLLTDMELIQDRRAAELLERLRGRYRAMLELMSQMFNDAVELVDVWENESEIYDHVMGHFQHSPLGEIDLSEPSGAAASDDDEDPSTEVLVFLLTDLAHKAWHAVVEISLSHVQTLVDRENGEGVSDEELRRLARSLEASMQSGAQLPSHAEARAKLADRVEKWAQDMRPSNG